MNIKMIKPIVYGLLTARGTFKLDVESELSETAQWARYLAETFPTDEGTAEAPTVPVESDSVIELADSTAPAVSAESDSVIELADSADTVGEAVLKFSAASIAKIKELPVDGSLTRHLNAIAVDELASIKGEATSIDDVVAANDIIINELTDGQRQFLLGTAPATAAIGYLLDPPMEVVTTVNIRLAMA